jgi:hypothetical protein
MAISGIDYQYCPVMHPTQHEKNEWSRMAQAAYREGHNSIGHTYSIATRLMTDNADRILAIISYLEGQGQAQMAEELRSLHIETETLRAEASYTRITLRELLDRLTSAATRGRANLPRDW